MKLRTKKLSLGIAFGVLLAGAFLIVSNAMNVGLPFFDDESTVSRTKNKSLDKDADSKDDKKSDDDKKDEKPSSPSNSQGVQKIAICHSTGDSKFVLIEVDDDATKQGHSGHELDKIPAPAGGCGSVVTTSSSVSPDSTSSTATSAPVSSSSVATSSSSSSTTSTSSTLATISTSSSSVSTTSTTTRSTTT